MDAGLHGQERAVTPAVRQDWYVYYKLTELQLSACLPQLQRLVQRLGEATGAAASLQRRTDDREGLVTVMEVYRGIDDPAAFESALVRAVAESSAHGLPAGERRIERFADIATADGMVRRVGD
jgi:hypothetical protein